MSAAHLYIKVTPTYETLTAHWGGNIVKYFLISQSYFRDEIIMLAKRNHFVPNSLLPYVFGFLYLRIYNGISRFNIKRAVFPKWFWYSESKCISGHVDHRGMATRFIIHSKQWRAQGFDIAVNCYTFNEITSRIQTQRKY